DLRPSPRYFFQDRYNKNVDAKKIRRLTCLGAIALSWFGRVILPTPSLTRSASRAQADSQAFRGCQAPAQSGPADVPPVPALVAARAHAPRAAASPHSGEAGVQGEWQAEPMSVVLTLRRPWPRRCETPGVGARQTW